MKNVIAALWIFFLCGLAHADFIVSMNLVDEKGIEKPAGEIVIRESPYGLVFTPNLKGLSPGRHGFHIHENPTCAPMEQDGKMVPAMVAGGHYDPEKTGRHGAPWGDGHLGDLPALYVDREGRAFAPVVAPRIRKTDEIRNRSLMIHAGGDNYSDRPAPLGGAGKRVACGIIP